jgi:hypothetical protein
VTALSVGAVTRTLFVSSRPVSWINTAFPFAAAYLLTTRQIDAPLIVGIKSTTSASNEEITA